MKESDSVAEILTKLCVCGGWIICCVFTCSNACNIKFGCISLSLLSLSLAPLVWVRHVLLFAQGLHRRGAGSASDRYIAWKESLSVRRAGGRAGVQRGAGKVKEAARASGV